MYPFYNVEPLFPFWGPFLFGRRRRRLNTIQMVPPPMKEMLPQDMKNAMDKVGQ